MYVSFFRQLIFQLQSKDWIINFIYQDFFLNASKKNKNYIDRQKKGIKILV